jgi:hypothetical protein
MSANKIHKYEKGGSGLTDVKPNVDSTSGHEICTTTHPLPFNSPQHIHSQPDMPSKTNRTKGSSRASPTVLRDISLNSTPAPGKPKAITVKQEFTQVQVKQEVLDVESTDGSAHQSVRSSSVNVARYKREGSVLSVDDARSTIDA